MPVSRVMDILAAGMIENQKRHAVISDNIANLNSTGFKKDRQVYRTFGETMASVINNETLRSTNFKGLHDSIYYTPTISNEVVITEEVKTSFEQGDLRPTGNDFDVAIHGRGFFAVRTESGKDMYTRDGSFMLNSKRELVTGNGDKVLVYGGKEKRGVPLVIDGNEVSILEDGAVKVDGSYVGKLRIVDFDNYDILKKRGKSLFEYLGDEKGIREVSSDIRQGYLESSNVNAIDEMTEMLANTKHYELAGKSIKSVDGTLKRGITELAKFR